MRMCACMCVYVCRHACARQKASTHTPMEAIYTDYILKNIKHLSTCRERQKCIYSHRKKPSTQRRTTSFHSQRKTRCIYSHRRTKSFYSQTNRKGFYLHRKTKKIYSCRDKMHLSTHIIDTTKLNLQVEYKNKNSRSD